MTFEEKYAAQGRKLDEMKAKLDEAVSARKAAHQANREEIAAEIAKLDAALDELDSAIDAQVDMQFDTLDAQVEKQADTMAARAEALDAQIDKQIDTIDAQVDKQVAALDAQAHKQMDDFGAAIDLAAQAVDKRVEKAKSAFTLDKATAEAVANEPTRIDDIQRGTAEQVARAKGDVAMAKENSRLAQEARDSKRDSIRLRTQMRVNSAKSKIAERKEAADKAEQEEWIFDLLEYADSCYETAYAWALEAEYTLMEAAYEIDYYNERFGKEEA